MRTLCLCFLLLASAGCSIRSVPNDGYTSDPIKVDGEGCFQMTKNEDEKDIALGIYCPVKR